MRTASTPLHALALATAAILALPAAGAAASTGGTYASNPARAERVGCSSGCADLHASRPGSTVRVYGRGMRDVRLVVFLGRPGASDDVRARPTKVRSRTVYVKVPSRAVGGPLRLYNADGTPSAPTPALDVDRGPTRTAAPGTVPPVDAAVDVHRAFYDGRRPAGLSFMVQDDRPVNVAITLVRATDGAVVAQWSPGVVAPHTAQSVTWDGLDTPTHEPAPAGRYEFRVYTATGGARAAAAGDPPAAAQPFLFLDHRFPILGSHHYGTGAGTFGAGRAGHSHQGQDVFADCGTPLVAARGGEVKIKRYEARAGNYVVIDGEGTDVDYVYMHLRRPALVGKGDHVYTGQRIGEVGDTGDAHGCHLHFELWSGPGWYTGGRPFDPLPDLRAWDAVT